MLSLIKIEVTPDIATKIRFMAEAGIFSIKRGNATLNFDANVLKSIKTELFVHAESYPHMDTGEQATILK